MEKQQVTEEMIYDGLVTLNQHCRNTSLDQPSLKDLDKCSRLPHWFKRDPPSPLSTFPRNLVLQQAVSGITGILLSKKKKNLALNIHSINRTESLLVFK